jgi:hypothetical protein
VKLPNERAGRAGRIGNWRFEIGEGGSIGFLVRENGKDFGLAIVDFGLGMRRGKICVG